MADADHEIELGCLHWSRKAMMAGISEFVGMTMFVFVGCGAAQQLDQESNALGAPLAMNLSISLTFGLAITTCVYMCAHRSGGHINPIVTLSLMLTGDCNLIDGLCIWMGQFLGSITGIALLAAMVDKNKSGNLGANQIGGAYDWFNTGVGETFMSFMLVLVIYETAIHQNAITRTDKNSRPVLAPVPIGLMVFLAHVVLIPVDGCSINPARSFGPALFTWWRAAEGEVDVWEDFMAFVIFPFAGATAAALVVLLLRGAGYFMNASKQEQGLRRTSVFEMPEVAGVQDDGIQVEDNTAEDQKDDKEFKGDFSE